MKDAVTIKITPKAYQLLRMVAALKRERQYKVLERLLQAEAEHVLKEKCGEPLCPSIAPDEKVS